jgi:hypothetical protein
MPNVKRDGRLFKKVPLLCPAERPFFVLPSASRASLASLGTALRCVIPRCVSAEGPLASLGATKKGLGATKKGLGETKKGLGETKKGLGETKKGLGETKKGLGVT